jgi:protein-disulfide isomerase
VSADCFLGANGIPVRGPSRAPLISGPARQAGLIRGLEVGRFVERIEPFARVPPSGGGETGKVSVDRQAIREISVMITRREFGLSSAVVLTLGGLDPLGGAARADTLSSLELMAKGALDDIAMGPENAPVTIIEYASMTCPHCAAFENTVFPELKKKYIDTGKVRFILREFPLDGLAAAAFMLARCAGPDKYYPMVETLFAQQAKWAVRNPIEPLMAIAKQAGFTQQSFEACINNKDALTKIQQVRDRASDKFKVKATPTFFINGERHEGGLSIEELDKILEPYLKT